MMKEPGNHKRAFGMLGLISFIALMATLTAAVNISSMRSTLGSMRGVERLQLQAAAEGAAVLLAAGDLATSSTITIGGCRITVTPEIMAEKATTQTVTSNSARLDAALLIRDRTRYARAWRITLPPATVMMEPLS